jgi:uroporphyrin-III C-methyltransferase / precorrin-2 dehydrogenase / sirohydrochlorin ferrochelatase
MPRPFPVFIKLTGRKVIVVGGGRVAAGKLPALVLAGADVVVVAPEVRAEIREFGTPEVNSGVPHSVRSRSDRRGVVVIEQREFRPEDLDGAWYVVAAATPEVNREVAQAAEVRRVFVNAVDDKDSASAYLGSVLTRGGVTVAFSTAGDAPGIAGLLREAIDALLPEELDRWIAETAPLRAEWKRTGVPIEERRPLLLQVLNRIYDKAPV